MKMLPRSGFVHRGLCELRSHWNHRPLFRRRRDSEGRRIAANEVEATVVLVEYARLRGLAPDDGRRELSEVMRALADTLHARPRTLWYGGTVMIVDGIALLTTIIGVGALVYPFGGPIVHLRHGRPAVAALDFGVRVAAPVAGVGLFIALGGRTSGGRGEFLSVPSAGAIASGILPCLGAMIF